MPALTQASAIDPRSIWTYGELVSNWLRIDAGAASERSQADGRPGGPGWRRCKRLVDVVGAAVLLVLLLPALSIILAVVWATGGAPIYGHERIGRGGRPFLCWKVRTMVPDAEARLEAILRADHGPPPTSGRATTSFGDDPRVTWLGRWLRLTSLDEVPQLWNVLRGEMSLVGPRPVTRRRAGAVRGERAALPGGAAGTHRHVAARRPQRPSLRAPGAARSLLRDEAEHLGATSRYSARTPFAIARRTGR